LVNQSPQKQLKRLKRLKPQKRKNVKYLLLISQLLISYLLYAQNPYCIGDSLTFVTEDICEFTAHYYHPFGTNQIPVEVDIEIIENTIKIPVPASLIELDSIVFCVNCGDVDCLYSDTIKLFENPEISLNIEEATICKGDSINLKVAGGDTYLWNTEPDTDSIWVQPNSTIMYRVEAIKNMCKAIDSIVVFVSQLPDIQSDVASVICLGETINLSVDTVFQAYKWEYQSGNNTITNETNSINDTPENTTTYFITATDLIECQDSLSITVNEASANQPTLNIEDTTICQGSNIELILENGMDVFWIINNDSLQGNSINIVGEEAQIIIDVKAKDANGCAFINSASIYTYLLPTDLTIDAPDRLANGGNIQINFLSESTNIKINENHSKLINADVFQATEPLILNNIFEQNLTLQSERTPQIAHFKLVPMVGECIIDTFYISTKVLPTSKDSLFIPDIFTPNSDGVNDTWAIQLTGTKKILNDYTLQIYNKNGVQIYSSPLSEDWNGSCEGKEAADGTYWYILTSPEGKNYKGAVTLIRN